MDAELADASVRHENLRYPALNLSDSLPYGDQSFEEAFAVDLQHCQSGGRLWSSVAVSPDDHTTNDSSSRDANSEHAYAHGYACKIRKLKHGRMGCAIVEFKSVSMREEVMHHVEQFPSSVDGVPQLEICGTLVRLRRHIDRLNKAQEDEVAMCIFISWSHYREKQSPLPIGALVDAFDVIVAKTQAPVPSALPCFRPVAS
eukprot:TRINITY_DN57389_c0_g1_i1.p1 TRINITY_DN57389_c0_g1~~TRINITY_DN57389_c0_g1_i1.p1  ORF type:complete len:201 (-),score=25.06 TRINITY_DN57389_c0_g1_i1:372-974(-)